MGDPRGFLRLGRAPSNARAVAERIHDCREFVQPLGQKELRQQASRCMDCGVPFCHRGCPLENAIPDWNDLVYRGRMDEALTALHATNNFPEVTGRVCPAPCETSCVLAMTHEAVTIKSVERAIADHGIEAGLLRPAPPARRTGARVAIVGSGPAGLAAAQQLARAGHDVVVFEAEDRVGGLLRYGIPDFKLEKWLIDLRVEQLEREGVHFRTRVEVGRDIGADALRTTFDAVLLAIGARAPRELDIAGRGLAGVHNAMDFLTLQNRRVAGDAIAPESDISASRKRVVVIGGGDTGADCVGTSTRQGAASVTQLEILAQPPEQRAPHNPWPEWPLVLRTSSSHEEGATRKWAVQTRAFVGDGAGERVRGLDLVRVELRHGLLAPLPGSEFCLEADLVLLAMGFSGPARGGALDQLGVARDSRGNVRVDGAFATSVPGVFAAGDASRGQSLVVWAIADGRRAAAAIDAFVTRNRSSVSAPAPA